MRTQVQTIVFFSCIGLALGLTSIIQGVCAQECPAPGAPAQMRDAGVTPPADAVAFAGDDAMTWTPGTGAAADAAAGESGIFSNGPGAANREDAEHRDETGTAGDASVAMEAIPGLAESIARVQQLQHMREASWPSAPPPPESAAPQRVQPVLYGMAQSHEPLIRQRAAEAWAALDTSEALEMLLNFLCDSDAEVRAIASRRLAAWPPEPLFEAVLRMLDGKDALRAAGVDLALPELRPVLETPVFALFVDESEPLARCAAAAYCLGRMGARQAIPKLAQGASSTETGFALACAQALHTLHAADQVPLWTELLRHSDASMRAIAIDALAQAGGTDALAALVNVATGATQERSIHLLQQAARGIALFPFDDAVPALIDVMKKNVKLRMFAYGMLELRTGVDAGQTPSEWQQWYDELKGKKTETAGGETEDAAAAPSGSTVPGGPLGKPNAAQPAIQGFSIVE